MKIAFVFAHFRPFGPFWGHRLRFTTFEKHVKTRTFLRVLALWVLLGNLWGPFWVPWCLHGSPLGVGGASFGSFLELLGLSLAPVGVPGAPFGSLWGSFWCPGNILDRILESLGVNLMHLGVKLAWVLAQRSDLSVFYYEYLHKLSFMICQGSLMIRYGGFVIVV